MIIWQSSLLQNPKCQKCARNMEHVLVPLQLNYLVLKAQEPDKAAIGSHVPNMSDNFAFIAINKTTLIELSASMVSEFFKMLQIYIFSKYNILPKYLQRILLNRLGLSLFVVVCSVLNVLLLTLQSNAQFLLLPRSTICCDSKSQFFLNHSFSAPKQRNMLLNLQFCGVIQVVVPLQ
ncbi:Hypothetical_protein [Hexamita inflata]|uniref:Hypothetical_protein n=1 Tax=Hexamita inflata TaxID=28002 RepID=A0AA86V2N0_9EUKA|nr:Hypothetical protein HINF_LOCUS61427 [Hexamita inflata]